jgi:nitroreductase
MRKILDTIYRRRSIRVFDGRKVSKEILIELLKAAMAAPSASNSKPWEFILVTSRTTLETLESKIKYGRYKAPAAVVICANTSLSNDESARNFWVQDCSAATENLLIAAAGLDIGTVWIGVYPREDVMQILRDMLNIPANVIPLNIVYVGYPADEPESRTQFEESRLHWEKY